MPTVHPVPAALGKGTATWPALANEKSLLARYVAQPDLALEAELVRRFMPLAVAMARRYQSRADQREDINQVASMALVKAIRRFDPLVGRNFAAFAAPTILGEIRRYFRDNTWRLRVPRAIQENTLAVERASAGLAEEHGRAPTMDEIARRAGISLEEVTEAFVALTSQRVASFDLPSNAADPESIPLSELVGTDEQGYQQVEAQLSVEACASLTEREHRVIQLRFEDGRNQHEIAAEIGSSQMQVSRILRRALAKMLEAVQGDDAPSGRRVLTETKPDARFPNGRSRVRVKSR